LSHSLTGQVALVTGATWIEDGGLNIGGAVAVSLARRGARVVSVDKNAAGLDGLVDHAIGLDLGGSVVGFGVDLRDTAALDDLLDRVVQEVGPVDVLVNNAGIFRADDGPAGDLALEVWDDVMAVNVRAPLRLIQRVLPHMVDQGRGSVVNTASTHAFAGDGSLTAYGASKASLIALTTYVATQYGRAGVRCNAVAPGTTLSPPAQRLPDSVKDVYLRHTLAPRLNSPEGLAELFTFLACDESRAVNGMVIRGDAGLLAHQPFFADMESYRRPKG